MERIHAFVSGRVQGVFFRAHTKRFAEANRITGWVRNLNNNRVEVVAEGDEGDIRNFLDFLHRGSPASDVKRVEVKKEKYTGELTGFSVRYL